MTIERRVLPLHMREAVKGSNGRQRWATAVTYRTVDTYGTLWTPGVFTAALEERMPTVLYGHDWHTMNHILGQGIDSREMDYGVDVLIEFADPAKIEAARTAMYLTEGERPIIRDVSVGFERFEWRQGKALTAEELALGAAEAMDLAGMDELSLVIRGAVPGASLRSRIGQRSSVDLDAVIEIGRRKLAGELTEAEAQAAIELLSIDDESTDGAPSGNEQETEGGDDDDAAAAEAAEQLAAEADAAVELALGRSRIG